jgi:hypothetical protein
MCYIPASIHIAYRQRQPISRTPPAMLPASIVGAVLLDRGLPRAYGTYSDARPTTLAHGSGTEGGVCPYPSSTSPALCLHHRFWQLH